MKSKPASSEMKREESCGRRVSAKSPSSTIQPDRARQCNYLSSISLSLLYVYIMSPGSINEKGECVGVDSEAYAILDTMRYIRPKIHTVAVGKCYGNAAMLLAAGDKGCRHALPNAQIMTHPPKLNRTFDTSVNVQIKANEIEVCEDTYMAVSYTHLTLPTILLV